MFAHILCIFPELASIHDQNLITNILIQQEKRCELKKEKRDTAFSLRWWLSCFIFLNACVLHSHPIWTKYSVLKHVWDQNDSENVIFHSQFLLTIFFPLLALTVFSIFPLNKNWKRRKLRAEGEWAKELDNAPHSMVFQLHWNLYAVARMKLN